jgi:hypothetical protein
MCSPVTLAGFDRQSRVSHDYLFGGKNPFIADACKRGDNHLRARDIRNSISLTFFLHRHII